MKKIDLHAIYKKFEIEAIIKGHIKLQTLRKFGLKALPEGGYLGSSVFKALQKSCKKMNSNEVETALERFKRKYEDASVKCMNEYPRHDLLRVEKRLKKIEEWGEEI